MSNLKPSRRKAAGVAIVALAILLPVALLAALAGWGWSSVRRRRREAALGPSA